MRFWFHKWLGLHWDNGPAGPGHKMWTLNLGFFTLQRRNTSMYQLKAHEHLTTTPNLQASWIDTVAKNQDPYGHAAIEAVVAAGKQLDAGATPEQSIKPWDQIDLTGYLAGCAAGMIAHYHPRGDEFRRWWNLRYQVRDEGAKANESGGILNPAILHLS